MALKGSSILNRLIERGFQAYFVGGCVRDTLLGIEPKDVDITTNAYPHEVEALFDKTLPTGKDYGTITVINEEGHFEVTTFRLESDYDGRRPKVVAFAQELKEDLERRDFTINAMAMTVTGDIIDYFQGQKDLKEGILRFVGDPIVRINEDKIRILRYVRFMCHYNLKPPEEGSFKSSLLNQVDISNLSHERIREEFNKIIMSPSAERGLRLLEEMGLLNQFFPELTRCKGFEQHHPAHGDDVFEHTLKVLKNVSLSVETTDQEGLQLRLGALCHDLGKVDTLTFDEAGIGHFYGHQKISAIYAEQFMKRLKYSNREIEAVKLLVIHHMRMYENLTRASARRLLSQIGVEFLDPFFTLQKADTTACLGDRTEHLHQIEQMAELCDEILKAKLAFSLKDLEIKGEDLLALGLKGPAVGIGLKRALEAVLSETLENEHEILIDFVKRLD